MSGNEKLKIFPVYFPQFHSIKENNINFYEDYTDITNLDMINKSRKDNLIDCPNKDLLKLNETLDYNLIKNEELIDNQINLLDTYNLNGFAMYYYWFSKNTITNENKIMYDVIKKFLNKDLKGKKIFYIWANENWTDNKAFGNCNNLIVNDYEDNTKLVNDLIKDFKNDNYLKIDNKPVFFIHHQIPPNKIEKIKNDLEKCCLNNGFSGIYLRFNNIFYENQEIYDFHPNYKNFKNFYKDKKTGATHINYKKYIQRNSFDNDITTLFFSFDNYVRLYKPDRLKYRSVIESTDPNDYKNYINKIKSNFNKYNNNILLINSWNEWGENMAIEPSENLKTYYLDLIKSNFS